jgi:hypothetical protein
MKQLMTDETERKAQMQITKSKDGTRKTKATVRFGRYVIGRNKQERMYVRELFVIQVSGSNRNEPIGMTRL